MRYSLKLFFIGAGLVLAPIVQAHGPQIQITRDTATGKIETREIIDTGSTPTAVSSLKSVYVMPFAPSTDVNGTAWYARPDQRIVAATGLPEFLSNPGVAWQYDKSNFAQGLPGTGWGYKDSATLPNLQGSQFSLMPTAGLKRWDGSAFVDPGTEQIELFRGSASAPAASAVTSDAGPFGTLPIGIIGPANATTGEIPLPSANPHTTLLYRLLGDGASRYAASDDGVYLLNLKLSSSAPGALDSDPFQYVLWKNATTSEVNAAVASLGVDASRVQVVPEPAAALIALVPCALMFVRRGRASRRESE